MPKNVHYARYSVDPTDPFTGRLIVRTASSIEETTYLINNPADSGQFDSIMRGFTLPDGDTSLARARADMADHAERIGAEIDKRLLEAFKNDGVWVFGDAVGGKVYLVDRNQLNEGQKVIFDQLFAASRGEDNAEEIQGGEMEDLEPVKTQEQTVNASDDDQIEVSGVMPPATVPADVSAAVAGEALTQTGSQVTAASAP